MPVTNQTPTSASASAKLEARYERVQPESFEPERHYYPRVLNAQIHPLARFFLSLDNERILARYCHLNPRVDPLALRDALSYQPRFFRWSGSDLLHVTNEDGVRKMVVIETNSCPSGQKSMPLYEETEEQGGYRVNLMRSFTPLLKGRRGIEGGLAVIYDKNEMEASGYAAALADLSTEPVHLVEFPDGAAEPRARFVEGVLEVRDHDDHWHPIRSAFRYVTQRPWNRIPVSTKTQILNPVISCLAGGRNKSIGAKAYEFYNADIADTGLHIHTPETHWDVSRAEVPLWVAKLGGLAVIKVPYANAGQGVYTITSPAELQAFERLEHPYERFVVQSLIGNSSWSSTTTQGRLYHVGTIPNKRRQSYVADLRVMVSGGIDGFRPLVLYARRARQPLSNRLGECSSWDMLGTNLSVRAEDGRWGSDAGRLMLVDRKDFNNLGLGLDDLIDAYIQAVLATIAIDKMAQRLISKKGSLRGRLFRQLNNDPALISEIIK